MNTQVVLKTLNDKFVISKVFNGQKALYAEGNQQSEAQVLEVIIPNGWNATGNTEIHLKTPGGEYVTLHGDTVVLDATGATEGRLFTPCWRGVWPVAFKASNGQYGSRDTEAGAKLMANRSSMGDWETFYMIKV